MEILCEVRNHVGLITLNRPAVLNALSHTMVLELGAQLHAWADDPAVNAVLVQGAGEKSFCAGGDIRALHQSYLNSEQLHKKFFISEYRLDYFIHRYPKPYIALLNGITMGGGMGIAQGAQLRIATDRTRMAMPEVGIGFIPDVGATYFLSRLPGALGTYFALTGTAIRAADALYAKLADCYFNEQTMAKLPAALDNIRWTKAPRADVEKSLRTLASELPDAPLAKLAAVIDQHFAKPGVAAILKSLGSETRSDYAEWAQQTLGIIKSRSPLELAVTLQQLQRGKQMTLAECFRLELGMVRYSFEQGNIVEGVRALIVDKDNKPQWQPARIEEVTTEMINAYLRSPWSVGAHPLNDLERTTLT